MKTKMWTTGEFNLSSTPKYSNSLQEVLKQEMIGQEILFRKQVYELHHLYQTQKTLMGDYGCKEPDVYKFLEERLHLPIRPYTNLMHYPSLEEGKLSRNFAAFQVGSTESLNHCLSSDSKLSSRDEVDLTLRIGEDTRKRGRVKETYYEKNSRFFPRCVIDLGASTYNVSQEDTKIASVRSYAAPVIGSEQNLQFYVQANQVSTHSARTDISHMTVSKYNVNNGKRCEEEKSINLGEPNTGISSSETSLKGNSFSSNASTVFKFDLNKVQCDDSFDLNDPAETCLLTPGSSSPFNKFKGIYSDEASCSHVASCEKANSDLLNEPTSFPPKKKVLKENLTDISDVEIGETREENITLLQPCKNKTRIEDMSSSVICTTTQWVGQMGEESVEVDALVQEAAESLFHFSLGSSVSDQDYSTKTGSNLIENEGNDRPQYSLDSYESLVLKLEETSVDDYCVSSKAFEVDEFDKKECGVMWRRGRRLKDFQKDILPNLVPLSRHEIREDVGAMKAAMRSREYKRMRSKAANGKSWFTPTKSKRSRRRRHYS